MNAFIQAVALSACHNEINKVLYLYPNCHFKIGKTSMPLQNRYKNGYAEEYDDIILVHQSSDVELIDWLKKELIKEYMFDYPLRCDNKQIGGGPDEEDIALLGMIYIVIKK